MSGQLKKLRIIAFDDSEMKKEVAEDTFVVQVNPQGYGFKHKIEYDKKQGTGTSANDLKFAKIPPQELELEFVFDATGAIPEELAPEYTKAFPKVNGVTDAVNKFKSVVLEYKGDKHKPRYLQLVWGTLQFKGVLTELDLNFKLFRPDGTPVRAAAKAKFLGSIPNTLREAKENNASPDVTHVRRIEHGENLPYLCHEIYGDSSLYLRVAAFNNITDIRRLRAGDTIMFPPVEK